jgi:hypothetical protein
MLVICEVMAMHTPEMPKVPALYSSLFFCGALAPLWRRFTAIIPPYRVAWAAYKCVRSVGCKASESVMGIYRRVRSAGGQT